MRAKYNQNYKNWTQMRRTQNFKDKKTENTGFEPKTNEQYCAIAAT